MKKILLIVIITLSVYLNADIGEVYFFPSNQSLTTAENVENEFDYILDPLAYIYLDQPWLFAAMDGYGSQFSNAFSLAWSSGFKNRFNFIISYEAEADYSNDSVDRDTYNRVENNLKVHTGFLLARVLPLSLQIAIDEDYRKREDKEYYDTNFEELTGYITDNYTDLEEESSFRLIEENHYSFDLGTAFSLSALDINLSVGYALKNPYERYTECIDNNYDYNGTDINIDETLLDKTTYESISGQLIDNYSSYVKLDQLLISYDRSLVDMTFISGHKISLDSLIKWDREDLSFSIPLTIDYYFYEDLTSTYTKSEIEYRDDTGELIFEDTTIEENTLELPYHIGVETGFAIDRSYSLSEKLNLYLGSSSDIAVEMIYQIKDYIVTEIYKSDSDLDGTYEDDSNDVDDNLDIHINQVKTDLDISGELALSYRVLDFLTLQASTRPTIESSLSIRESLIDVEGDQEKLTDQVWDVLAYNTGRFGFTMELNENLKLDAESTFNGLALDHYSVIVMFSY